MEPLSGPSLVPNLLGLGWGRALSSLAPLSALCPSAPSRSPLFFWNLKSGPQLCPWLSCHPGVHRPHAPVCLPGLRLVGIGTGSITKPGHDHGQPEGDHCHHLVPNTEPAGWTLGLSQPGIHVPWEPRANEPGAQPQGLSAAASALLPKPRAHRPTSAWRGDPAWLLAAPTVPVTGDRGPLTSKALGSCSPPGEDGLWLGHPWGKGSAATAAQSEAARTPGCPLNCRAQRRSLQSTQEEPAELLPRGLPSTYQGGAARASCWTGSGGSGCPRAVTQRPQPC